MSTPETPEAVAYELLLKIADTEGYYFSEKADKSPSAEWILRTYAACLGTVKGYSRVDDWVATLDERP